MPGKRTNAIQAVMPLVVLRRVMRRNYQIGRFGH